MMNDADVGSEIPLCLPVSRDCISHLSGYVARRLSLTTLDPPLTVAGNHLLHPRNSSEQEEHLWEQSPVQEQSESSTSSTSCHTGDGEEEVEITEKQKHAPQREREREAETCTTDRKRKFASIREHKVVFAKRKGVESKEEVKDLARYSAKALGDLFASTVCELHTLKERLKVLELYNQLGTTRAVAAADMVEFAVSSLGFSLRQAIARDFEGRRISRDRLFGAHKIFWRGDLRDVNYTACWWWFVKSTQRSNLLEFWREAGYEGEVLSMEWYTPFKHKENSADCSLLLQYITHAEEDFSKLVHLTKQQIHFCIGLFLCGPKLDRNKDRNKDVHLFGLWELVRGSKIDVQDRRYGRFELSVAERESLHPKPIDFTIEEVRRKRFVLNDLITHLDELPSYYQHQAAAMRAIGAFLMKELGKACGRAVRKALAHASKPSAAENFSIPGTYLTWSEGFNNADGYFHVSLYNEEEELPVPLAISDEGLWWRFEEGKWIEVLDAPNKVLSCPFPS